MSSTHLRFLLLVICCAATAMVSAQTYFHPTAGIQSSYAGNCEVNLCSGVYVDDGGTGGNYANNVNNVYRTFCPSAPGQCIRLSFTQFSLEAPDLFGDCYDYLTIGSGPTQNSPVVWQGCGATLPPAITSTDPSGCLTMRFVSDAIVSAAGWRANITCVPCGGSGPSASLSNDCSNAQYVCDNLQPINANSQGPGLVSDVCVSGCAISENYSNWFILNVTSPGATGFTITPTPTIADYDFTLYGPVSGGCSNLGAPLRCSYAANTGTTGMRSISPDPSEDVNGDGWVSSANLAVGTYYLLVNQWAYEPNSTFRLDFNGTSVIGLPQLTVSSNSPVCSNQALQFTGPTVAGATYSWSGPGGWTSTQQNPTRNPPVAGTYTFSYMVNGCNSPAISNISVVVNNAPTAQINPSATSICPGQNAILTASGGLSYVWSNSATTASITVSPASTSTYTVTVTSNGCTATTSATVTVNANLAVSINPPSAAICNGGSATLTASGGASYQWSNSANTATIVVTPTNTTTYTVTATNGASCTGTASATVTVNGSATASIAPATVTICNGQSATLTGSGGTSYLWSTTETTASITVAPTVTTIYVLTVTDANGCTATAQRTVNVNSVPVPTITPATTSICSGENLALTAGGGTSYLWSTTETTATINVAPLTTTTYTVTVTGAGGCTATLSRTITVNTTPAAGINPVAVSICNGTSTTLTASGGISYLWSNTATTPGTSVAPTVSTTYTVTVTGMGGCTATATAVVTVNDRPTVTITPPVAAICGGGSVTLSASGGTGYVWSTTETTQDITVAPTVNTTYTVTVTDANGCTGTASRAVTISSPPVINILPLNVTICEGESTTLTASGGTGYTWSTTETTDVITVTPATTTTYTVTVTEANGCTGTASRTVTVNTRPVVTINPAAVSICEGQNTALTASGGNSYVWSTTEIFPGITVSPLTTTTYTVTATAVNSCTATASATVTVNTLPVASITPASASFCIGGSTTLSAGGGASYLWSTTETTQDITVTPLNTTTYTVTVSDGNSCTATATSTVTVNQNPVAAITPASIAICEGENTMLDASGGVSYLWSTTETSQGITVSPGSTSTYSVTVTDNNNCTASATSIVTVHTNPTISVTPPAASICEGASQALTANGGTSYAWSTTETTQNITVSPVVTTTYTVTGTDANSCSATATATVTVNTLPVATITPSAVSICEGESAALTANGGASFLWSTTETTAGITVSPLATTTYTVTVTNGSSCSATATSTVTVNTAPTAAISPASVAICEGTSTMLSASGGTAYLWSTTETTLDITVTPVGTTTYTVTVADGNNCTASTTSTVTVNTNPTISIAPPNAAICAGGSETLTANGGTSYVWSTTETTQSITVNPITTTTYTVTGTDGNSCSATATATVDVNALPTASILPNAVSICEGTNITLTASGGTSFLWSTTETTNAITVSPLTTTTYTVTVTDGNACSATATSVVTVNQNPTAVISPAAASICEGATTTLSASGGASYLWSTTETTQDITVSPAATASFTVTITDGNNCTASTTSTITVNTNPTISVAPPGAAICAGESAILTANGATSYLWSTTETTQSITVNPITTTTYTVTGTDGNSCSATATASVTVNALPNVTITPLNVSLCNGSNATLTANGGTTYLWSTTETTANITVAPAASTTYTVTVTDGNSCSVVATRTVFVNQNLVVDISPAVAAICEGTSTTLTATGGTTYTWSTTETTDAITVNPLVTTTYSVTADDVNGCTGTASRDVTVNLNPTAVINPASVAICQGESTVLTSGGGTGYVWSSAATTNAITVTPFNTSTFTVTVTDGNGCTAETSRTVDINPAPVVSISPVAPVVCSGGATTLTATGGTGYVWSTTATTDAITVSPANTSAYTVTVTDGSGCSASASESVTVHPLPVASISPSPANICEGGNAILTATGGVSYLWSTTETTDAITVAPAATSSYDVTVTDGNNCTATTSSTVHVNQNPVVTITPPNRTICGGQNVTLTATGASTYAWSTTETGGSINVAPFATTTYSVTGTDANSCTGEASSTIDVTASMTLTPTPDDVSCNNGSDGAVDIEITGGQPPFTYQWSNGAITQDITGIPADNYSITVSDDIGCASTISAVVTEPDAIIVNGTIVDASCNDGTDGAIDLDVTGGVTPYAYAWSDGNLNADRVGLSSGNYSVIVTDANTCTANSDFIITEGTIINIGAVPTNPSCPSNGTDGNILLDITGGASPYLYAWSNGNTAQNNSALGPGNYSVTVTDDNGCSETADYTLTYEYIFEADAGNGSTITVGQSITLGYTTTGNAGNITSNIWAPAQTLSCNTCPAPSATPPVTTLYTLTVENEAGCADTTTITVTVIEEGQVVAPNAFTPNGDGSNDEFQIYGNIESIDFFEAQVYNRWGEKVFESTSPTFKWDGTYRGVLLRPDVYIYQVRLNTFNNKQVRVHKGSVTLMR